jgi:hypothetical protein
MSWPTRVIWNDGATRKLPVEAGADLGRRDGGDLGDQLADVLGALRIVEAGNQLDRLRDALEIGGELALGGVVQHGNS